MRFLRITSTRNHLEFAEITWRSLVNSWKSPVRKSRRFQEIPGTPLLAPWALALPGLWGSRGASLAAQELPPGCRLAGVGWLGSHCLRGLAGVGLRLARLRLSGLAGLGQHILQHVTIFYNILQDVLQSCFSTISHNILKIFCNVLPAS